MQAQLHVGMEEALWPDNFTLTTVPLKTPTCAFLPRGIGILCGGQWGRGGRGCLSDIENFSCRSGENWDEMSISVALDSRGQMISEPLPQRSPVVPADIARPHASHLLEGQPEP